MRHDTFPARRSARAAALALGLLAGTTSLLAQGTPSDAVMRGFKPSSEYDLTVAGKTIPTAQIFVNTSIPGYLILSSSLSSPVLLLPREGSAKTVSIMKVAKQPDGSVDLLADAVLSPAGQFKLIKENIVFMLDKKTISLNPKPPILGARKNAELKAQLPEYARGAKSYTPNAAAVAALKKETDAVVVKIYFGSWCPHCREHVPFLLRVEDDVKNPKIQFQYYGLPQDFNDPEAKRLGIKGVPTGIVYVNGKEAGRLSGAGWSSPEVLISKILASPAAQAKK
jgi:thiol-disulfide isomerase/thioredoxin